MTETTTTTKEQTTLEEKDHINEFGVIENFTESECRSAAMKQVSGFNNVNIGSVERTNKVTVDGPEGKYYQYTFLIKGNQTYMDEYGHYRNRDFSRKVYISSDLGY